MVSCISCIQRNLSQLYFVPHLFELQVYEFPGHLYIIHLLCENNTIYQKLIFLSELFSMNMISIKCDAWNI